MHPDLIAGLPIKTYGFCMALGFLAAWQVLSWLCRRTGRAADPLSNLLMLMLFSGIIGARLEYVREFWEREFASNPLSIFKIWQGGLVFYGGLLGAIAGAFITAHYLKRDIREYYPALVPGIAIMAGFGRIGCFLTGCCYGAETSSPIHVVYPEGGIVPGGIPLVPVQLYEAAFDFILVIVLVILSAKSKGIRPHLLNLYCLLYAVFRFILEFWRADSIRGALGPFSTSQWISLFLIVCVSVKEVLNTRRKAENTVS